MIKFKWKSLQPDSENYNWRGENLQRLIACDAHIGIMPASGWANVRSCSVKFSIRGRSARIRVMGLF